MYEFLITEKTNLYCPYCPDLPLNCLNPDVAWRRDYRTLKNLLACDFGIPLCWGRSAEFEITPQTHELSILSYRGSELLLI